MSFRSIDHSSDVTVVIDSPHDSEREEKTKRLHEALRDMSHQAAECNHRDILLRLQRLELEHHDVVSDKVAPKPVDLSFLEQYFADIVTALEALKPPAPCEGPDEDLITPLDTPESQAWEPLEFSAAIIAACLVILTLLSSPVLVHMTIDMVK